MRVGEGEEGLDPAPAAAGPAVKAGVAGDGGDVVLVHDSCDSLYDSLVTPYLVLDPRPAQPCHSAPQATPRQRCALGQALPHHRLDDSCDSLYDSLVAAYLDVGRPVRRLTRGLGAEHARGLLVRGEKFKTSEESNVDNLDSQKMQYLAASSPVTHCFDRRQKCSGMLRESALGEAGGARPVS